MEGIDHIHIVVRDLDKAAFYKDVFGVKFTEEIIAEQWPMARTPFGLLGTVILEVLSTYAEDDGLCPWMNA